MRSDDGDVRALLVRLLVFLAVLVVAQALFICWMRLSAYDEGAQPVVAIPREEKATTDAKGEIDVADEVVFGSKYPIHGSWFDPTEDIYMLGAVYPASGAPATEAGVWEAGLWPDWSPTLGLKANDLGTDSPAIWASYDATSYEALRAGAYINVEIGADPEAPLDWNDIMLGVYDQPGNLVGHSEPLTVYAADGEQEVEFAFEETFTIDPEASYYLFVWARYGPGACHVFVGYGTFPVSFSEVIPVAEVLRLAVRFGETISIDERLRVGVAFSEHIDITEQLKARIKPSAKTGFCLGHYVSEEDAGGKIE